MGTRIIQFILQKAIFIILNDQKQNQHDLINNQFIFKTALNYTT